MGVGLGHIGLDTFGQFEGGKLLRLRCRTSCSSFIFYSQNFSEPPHRAFLLFWDLLKVFGGKKENVVETQRTRIWIVVTNAIWNLFQTLILPFESGDPKWGSPERKNVTFATVWIDNGRIARLFVQIINVLWCVNSAHSVKFSKENLAAEERSMLKRIWVPFRLRL